MELEQGKTYKFKAHGRYNVAFQGVIEKIYEHSVMVYLPETKDRAIISQKYIKREIKGVPKVEYEDIQIKRIPPRPKTIEPEQSKKIKTEEQTKMKFNLDTATLLLPATTGAEGKECLIISKSGLVLGGPVVRRLNKPEWVRLYLDESKQALFVFTCEAADEGARSCVKPKSNKKAGYRKSWKGSVLKKVAEVANMDIENHRYYVDPEKVEGSTRVLGFDLTKAKKE